MERGLHERWSVWRWEVDTDRPRTSPVLSLWIPLNINIGSSTKRTIAPWHTSLCQKARNSRLWDTAYNNSTHLYWFKGLKRTDQFSVFCAVYHCAFSRFFSPKVFEMTCGSSKCPLALFCFFFLFSIYFYIRFFFFFFFKVNHMFLLLRQNS